MPVIPSEVRNLKISQSLRSFDDNFLLPLTIKTRDQFQKSVRVLLYL